MVDYTDYAEMTELFFIDNGREPTDDELNEFIVDMVSHRADMLFDQMKDREYDNAYQ